MKKLAIAFILVGANLFLQHSGFSQLASTCETCFSADLLKAEKLSETCIRYEMKVFFTEKCRHDLSHFTVAVPSCASVSQISNSEGWPIKIGNDPTTNVSGFKVDNISGFGSGTRKSFTVSFTLCSNQSSCQALTCWEPTVAFKAGNCFETQVLKPICPKLKASIKKTDANCFGSATGSLQVIIEEGTAPFTYLWSDGVTTAQRQNLKSGTYSVMINDATGAEVNLSATVSEPTKIEISGITSPAKCSGQQTGAITIDVSGGKPPYTYAWSNLAITKNVANLKSGTYAVTVEDSIGCTSTATFSITHETTIYITSTLQQPACGNNNGSIQLNVSGGTEPYTYLWSNGQTTPSLTHVPAGSYQVTVTDSSGCSANFSVWLRENNSLKSSYSVKPTSCLDDRSGSIDLTITGGTAPYSYLWSNGAVTEDVSGLAAGSYTVVVTDDAGCKVTVRISVFRQTFSVTADVVQPTCADGAGAITLKPTGGAEPYSYNWSNGSTTNTIENLSEGNYSVTITDATGCSRLMVYTITSPSAINASILTSSDCSTTTLDLSVSGGTQPYTYSWSNGANTQDISTAVNGDYSVIITDANNCSVTKEVTVAPINSWTCAIQPLAATPVCGSTGNVLATNLTGANYQWSVSSTDGSWKIESGTNQSGITFTSGNANTAATFTLTITQDGCTQTCSYETSTCTTSSGGGNDNGGDNGSGGSNDESCDDCFNSTIIKSAVDETCVTYQVTVSTNGNCRYELSHFTVAIPCGTIQNYATDSSWPIVLGKDPTTGLTGLKVDNINGFGKERDSFELTFTVCYTSLCGDTWKDWNPVVAYKAGQCVGYDTLIMGNESMQAQAYPNPFTNTLSFCVGEEDEEVVSVELFDQHGEKVMEKSNEVANTIILDVTALKAGIYYYVLRKRAVITSGKLLKM